MKNLKSIPVRILVTGTRGKSSLVRLLHAGLLACGMKPYSRITGVLPRELGPSGVRAIRREAPANAREMQWWISQIPDDAEAVVMENSAVAPELQPAAGRWLEPTLVVWATLRSDHEDVWGPGVEGAAKALLEGVPPGVPVVASYEVEPLRGELEARGCPMTFLQRDGGPDSSFRDVNARLAMAALACVFEDEPMTLALGLGAAKLAMDTLEPDIADFRIMGEGEDLLAVAFSANEVVSTAQLLKETGWDPAGTTLLYHHRPDREARLRSFLPWINSIPWKEVVFTRQKSPLLPLGELERLPWLDQVHDPESFEAWRRGRGRIFACGNVAGWPLEFLMERFGIGAEDAPC